MQKRIFFKISIMGVLLIFGLFAATGVGAEPSPYDYPSFSVDGYTVTAVAPFPEYIACDDSAESAYPCDELANPTGFYSKYTWQVTPAELSHFDILVPKNIVDRIPPDFSFPNVECDGTGDPSTGFGKHLQWHCTAKWDWENGDFQMVNGIPTISLVAYGQLSVSPTDFIVKQSTQAYPGIINGAFYNETIPVGATTGTNENDPECIVIDDKSEFPISMSLVRDPVTGYARIPSIRFYTTPDCSGDGSEPDKTQPEDLVYCSGGPRKLNECIQLKVNSPGCVEYYVGNTLCTWCYPY